MLDSLVPSAASVPPCSSARLFTIVTIVRNNADGLRLTTDSVIAQTYRAFEWIIIDGASTDETRNLLETLRSHADTVVSEPDAGIYDAMNKGLKLATGEYVFFLNAGDMFATPDALSHVAARIKATPAPRPTMIFCAAELRITGNRYWVQSPRGLEHIWHSMPTSHQALMVRTRLHKQFPFDTTLRIAADYDAVARMSLVDDTALLIDVIISRVWRGADSTSIRRPMAGIRDMARTQRDVLRLSKATITISATRRFVPLITMHLLEMPVLSPLAYGMIRLLRPRSAAESA
jgi:putative colanic acid biosynthesis glycosyltransferase